MVERSGRIGMLSSASAEDSGGILSAIRIAAASAERVWRGSGDLVCRGPARPVFTHRRH
jgi:hypothetical protein